MRIISPFKDYYDCVQATGQDQNMVYLRTPKETEPSYPFPCFLNYCYSSSHDFRLINHTVGFCGKLYPVIEVIKLGTDTNKFCYTVEDVDAFIEANYKDKEIEAYYSKKWAKNWTNGCQKVKFQRFFDEFKGNDPCYDKYFRDNHCPVFLGVYKSNRENTVTYNACLKDVEFYRIFDPYMAFQEISMYLGGMAVPQKEMPEISDKIMSEIKGFDKYSFRKDPVKKK